MESSVPPPVGLVLLAAGASRRLGQPKQLLRYVGKSLLRRAAETALATGCGPLVVVSGALQEELVEELTSLPATLAHNPRWAQGLGPSVSTGVAALRQVCPTLSAILLLVSDQPHLSTTVLCRLVAAHREDGARLAAATYSGVLGVPALFGKEFFDELNQLPAQSGAGQLLRRYAAMVTALPWDGGAVDIDTPARAYASKLNKCFCGIW